MTTKAQAHKRKSNPIDLYSQNCQSVHTQRNSGYTLRRFADWLKETYQVDEIEQVTAAHVIAYRQHLEQSELAPISVARTLECIRSFSRWAYSEGLVPVDFARNVKSPRPTLNREPTYLETNETRRLFDAIDPAGRHAKRDQAMAWVLATGLRVGEVVALNVGDVIPPADGKLAGLRVHGKRSYERTIPLSKAAYDAIQSYITERGNVAQDAPLFACRYAGESDRRLTTRAVEKWFADLVTSAGLDKSKAHPHAARHGFTTRLLFEGNTPGSLYTVSRLLGHTSLATTEKYVHLDRAALQTAILNDPLTA